MSRRKENHQKIFCSTTTQSRKAGAARTNHERMASEEEQALTETLVDPETLDNPDGQWTKGEPQPPKCRDAWAALLFYGQFIAIAVVAGMLGVPAVEKYNNDSIYSEGTVDYTGLLYGECNNFVHIMCSFLLHEFSPPSSQHP